MTTEYGSRLKLARVNAKLTQANLSKKTGIPQSTISTAERSGHGSRETAVYAQVCGVSALWLATGQGEMHTSDARQDPASTQSAGTAVATNPNDGRPLQALQVLGELSCLMAGVTPERLELVSVMMAALVRKPADKDIANAIAALITPQAFAQDTRQTG